MENLLTEPFSRILKQPIIDKLLSKHVIGILKDVFAHIEPLSMPELVPFVVFIKLSFAEI